MKNFSQYKSFRPKQREYELYGSSYLGKLMQTDAYFLFSPTKVAIVAGFKSLIETFKDEEMGKELKKYLFIPFIIVLDSL